jgi:hypothetical protein
MLEQFAGALLLQLAPNAFKQQTGLAIGPCTNPQSRTMKHGEHMSIYIYIQHFMLYLTV